MLSDTQKEKLRQSEAYGPEYDDDLLKPGGLAHVLWIEEHPDDWQAWLQTKLGIALVRLDQANRLLDGLVGLYPANILDQVRGEWECRFCNKDTRIAGGLHERMMESPLVAAEHIAHYDDCVWAEAVEARRLGAVS